MRGTTTLLLLTALVATPAAAQRRQPTESRVLGTFDRMIRESSGIAVSRAHPGVFWTHNDSGDGPTLYAVDSTASVLARYAVTGAQAVDWEDIALGPCPDPRSMGAWCLFIADIGDNPEEREAVTIYIVAEPAPHPAEGNAATRPARRLRIRYATGPRDAEALSAYPNGDLALTTKGRSGPILQYRIPREAILSDSMLLVVADTVPIRPVPFAGRWITSAAISASGERAVLGTHTELYFFGRNGDGWAPEGAACWLGLPLRQWEAVDFLDEETVVVTSERSRGGAGVVRLVRC